LYCLIIAADKSTQSRLDLRFGLIAGKIVHPAKPANKIFLFLFFDFKCKPFSSGYFHLILTH
jgi:hypothetical protein